MLQAHPSNAIKVVKDSFDPLNATQVFSADDYPLGPPIVVGSLGTVVTSRGLESVSRGDWIIEHPITNKVERCSEARFAALYVPVAGKGSIHPIRKGLHDANLVLQMVETMGKSLPKEVVSEVKRVRMTINNMGDLL